MPPTTVTTAQLQQAAIMRAQGISYQAIEETIGLPHSVAHRAFQKDEINQLIKQAQIDLISGSLRDAVANQAAKIQAAGKIVRTIADGKTLILPDGTTKLMELGARAEEKLLESVGIHPSHTQSISLTQIMIDARSELSPTVERLLVEHLGGDVIDVKSVDNPVDNTDNR